LFFRNAVHFAFPILECPGVDDAFEEGDVAEVDVLEARVRNLTRGTERIAKRLPAPLLAIINAGGIYPLLEKEGSIARKA
jgi:3-isopropylmalate/(R)-2-methylmalate dehydratase small subunit